MNVMIKSTIFVWLLVACFFSVSIFAQDVNVMPVVFVHNGKAEYLTIALKQARKYNQRVILIGDCPQNIAGQDIEFHDIKLYSHSVEKATAPFINEAAQSLLLYSIQRWVILADFMQKNDLKIIFHCDSDVLLYSNITKEMQNFLPFDLVLTHDVALHYASCRQYAGSSAYCTLDGVRSFCDYITWFHENKENWEYFSTIWNHNHCPMGEMFLLTSYVNSLFSKKICIKDLNVIIEDSMFDNFIGSDCFNFSMKKIFAEGRNYLIKDIQFHDGIPYCFHKGLNKNIKLNSIHFFMGTKVLMKEYLEYSDVKPASL